MYSTKHDFFPVYKGRKWQWKIWSGIHFVRLWDAHETWATENSHGIHRRGNSFFMKIDHENLVDTLAIMISLFYSRLELCYYYYPHFHTRLYFCTV